MSHMPLSLSEQIKYISELKLDGVIDQFLDHVRNTNMPESFPGLLFTKPNKEENFLVLTECSVDLHQRPKKRLVPCSICRPNSGKYYKKCYLIVHLPSAELRIVGSTCCRGELDGWQEALTDLAKRQREQYKRAFIKKNANLTYALQDWIEELTLYAAQYQKLRKQLAREFPDFWRALTEAANRSPHQLTVTRIVQAKRLNKSTGKFFLAAEEKEDRICELYGASFCTQTFPALDKLKEAQSIFQLYSPEVAINESELPEEIALKDYPKKWRQAQGLGHEAEELLQDARKFLTQHNFEGIRRWTDTNGSRQFVRPIISDTSYIFRDKISGRTIVTPRREFDIATSPRPERFAA